MWRKENDIQTMLRDSAGEFLGREHNAQRIRGLRGTLPGYHADFWMKMVELGWAGMLLPEDDGGSGLGMAPALTLANCFGEHLVPEPFISCAIMSATLLDNANSDVAASARAKMASGESLFLPALAGQGAVAPVLSVDGDTCRVDGTLQMVPDWSPAAMLLVECQGPEGAAILLIDGKELTVQTQQMADGTWSARTELEGADVAKRQILLEGPQADAAIELARARGTVALCALLDGLTKRLMAMTIEYVTQRCQFNRALSDFQALRHGIADLYIQHELSSASWRSAAERLEADGAQAAEMAIAAAKARSSAAAMLAAKAGVQYHGAFGYTVEADIGLYVNATLRNAARMGSATQQITTIADIYHEGRYEHA